MEQEVKYNLKEFLHDYEKRNINSQEALKKSLNESIKFLREDSKESTKFLKEDFKVCVFFYKPE